MASFRKQIVAKIYDSTDQLITTWPSFEFDGFSKELNAGIGECVLRVPFRFDYGGGDLNLGNRIDLVVSDRDTVANPSDSGSRVIYRGYISLIERDANGAQELVTVHLLGYYTLLALDILKNGTQTTLYSTSSGGLTTTIGSIGAGDLGLLMRAVIDRYIAENINVKISYDVADIPIVSTTVQYSFKQTTYRAAMDAIQKFSPTGYFYYVNELGKISFKQKALTPTHKFIFGKHFSKVHIESSLEKVRNFILISDGLPSGLYKHYEDDGSISAYGRRAQTDNDYGIVGSTSAADKKGGRFLADNAQPDLKIVCTIIDNNGDSSKGYDIESIQPGDTCSFYGFASGAAEIFRDNMVITKVDYTLDSVDLTVEIIKSGLVDQQFNQAQIIQEISSGAVTIPATYT